MFPYRAIKIKHINWLTITPFSRTVFHLRKPAQFSMKGAAAATSAHAARRTLYLLNAAVTAQSNHSYAYSVVTTNNRVNCFSEFNLYLQVRLSPCKYARASSNARSLFATEINWRLRQPVWRRQRRCMGFLTACSYRDASVGTVTNAVATCVRNFDRFKLYRYSLGTL